MSGNMRLFQIELTDVSGAHLALVGGRLFDQNCYYLEFADFSMQLWPDEAERFARVARIYAAPPAKEAGRVLDARTWRWRGAHN